MGNTIEQATGVSTVWCAKCEHDIHITRLADHPCEYLRLNLSVAKAEGIKAAVRYFEERISDRQKGD